MIERWIILITVFLYLENDFLVGDCLCFYFNKRLIVLVGFVLVWISLFFVNSLLYGSW
jgi:hypothetical protein